MDQGPTRRQREVAELVARGMTNRQIAQTLFISERTAEGHVQQLFNLLGVSSRTQLATWWVEQQAGGESAGDGNGERGARHRSRTNLPMPLTSFLGRERQLAELPDLQARYRVVTLVGVGGGGKTRLALELGPRLLDRHPDGVWLVELAGIADGRLVPQAVTAALRMGETAGRPPLDTLLEHLRDRRLLLLLDNCEHLLDSAASLVHRVLTSCPGVRVLATSREALGVPGELSYWVPSLPHPGEAVPAGATAMGAYDSVRLFVDRARAGDPAFALTDANAAGVGAICARLDGIPLAIELAAGWTHPLGVDGILERLEDRFRLLVRSARTAPPRQQTLAAAIDWSYDLLSEEERALFRRLSVFAGPFGLAEVEAVCVEPGEARDDVLLRLSRLVDKSLVLADEGGYRCLETIREYAARRLREAGERPALARRHARHFARLTGSRRPGELARWLARVGDELPNLHAALDWAIHEDPALAVELATAIFPYWQLRGRMTEARQFLEALIEVTADLPGGRARALALGAACAYSQNDPRQALAWVEDALALARAGEPEPLAAALRVRGLLAMVSDDMTGAEACFEEALSVCRDAGDVSGEAQALHDLAQVAGLREQLAEARALFQHSLDIRTRNGLREEGHVTLTFLALIALLAGDTEGARPALREALESARRLRDRRAAWALDVGASLAAAEGDGRRALVLAGAAAAMHEAAGTMPAPTWHRLMGLWLDPARAALPPDEALAAAGGGRAMDFDAALDHALS
jgi:non-specific serine/threonine protein kinase